MQHTLENGAIRSRLASYGAFSVLQQSPFVSVLYWLDARQGMTAPICSFAEEEQIWGDKEVRDRQGSTISAEVLSQALGQVRKLVHPRKTAASGNERVLRLCVCALPESSAINKCDASGKAEDDVT